MTLVINEQQFDVWTDWQEIDLEDLEIEECHRMAYLACDENRLWAVTNENADNWRYVPALPGYWVDGNAHAYLITEQSHEGLDIEVDVWAEFTLYGYLPSGKLVGSTTVKATNLDHAVILAAEKMIIEDWGVLHIAINEPNDYLEALEHDVTTHADLLNWIRAGRNHKDFW